MDEAGFLTPDESLAQQHTRARLLAPPSSTSVCTSDRSPSRFGRDLSRPHRDVSGGRARRDVQELDVSGTAIMYCSDGGLHELRRARRGSRRVVFPCRSRPRAGVRLDPVPLLCGCTHEAHEGSDPGSTPRTALWNLGLAGLLCLLGSAGCARRPAATPPSNDLLIVGYDREPTAQSFSTHILEDIQSCIVEGLTTTDERMNVVPLLATEVPTIKNGGVRLRPDGGMDVTWKLRSGVTWHDGTPFTSADVKFTVDAINGPNYNPESTDGFDRISSVDTPDPLTAVVHYREIYAPYEIQFIRGTRPGRLDGRDMIARRTTTAVPSVRGPTGLRSGERANTSCSSACLAIGEAVSTRASGGSCSSSSRTRTHASISSKAARCTSSRSFHGTRTAKSPA